MNEIKVGSDDIKNYVRYSIRKQKMNVSGKSIASIFIIKESKICLLLNGLRCILGFKSSMQKEMLIRCIFNLG